MPTIAQVDTPFGALVSGAPVGLVGTISAEVYDPVDGRSVYGPSTNSITEPRAGSYFATLTLTEPGSFSLRWTAAGWSLEEDVISTVAPVPVPVAMRPTIEEVSALLYDRIVKQGGHMADVFDETTTPKASQVQLIIDQTVNQLLSRADVPIKPDQSGQGRWLATLYSSAMVALVFVPEQSGASTTYTGLMTEFGAQINEWIRANRYPLAAYIG